MVQIEARLGKVSVARNVGVEYGAWSTLYPPPEHAGAGDTDTLLPVRCHTAEEESDTRRDTRVRMLLVFIVIMWSCGGLKKSTFILQ